MLGAGQTTGEAHVLDVPRHGCPKACGLCNVQRVAVHGILGSLYRLCTSTMRKHGRVKATVLEQGHAAPRRIAHCSKLEVNLRRLASRRWNLVRAWAPVSIELTRPACQQILRAVEGAQPQSWHAPGKRNRIESMQANC